MLIDALIEVSARIPDIVCIAQTTLIMVNNALLVNDRRLLFFRFDLVSDLKACIHVGNINSNFAALFPILTSALSKQFQEIECNQNAFFDEISEHARLLRPQASQAHVYRKRRINYLFIHISVTAVRIGA